MILATRVASDIVDGGVAPYTGARQIWLLTLKGDDEKVDELDPFVYAASEWEERPEDRAFFAQAIVRRATVLVKQALGGQ